MILFCFWVMFIHILTQKKKNRKKGPLQAMISLDEASIGTHDDFRDDRDDDRFDEESAVGEKEEAFIKILEEGSEKDEQNVGDK